MLYLTRKNMNQKTFRLALLMIGCLSIPLSVFIFNKDPLTGIFIGLWAPTMTILANYFKD